MQMLAEVKLWSACCKCYPAGRTSKEKKPAPSIFIYNSGRLEIMCAQLKDPLFSSKPCLISVYNSGLLYRTDPHRCLVHCARDVSLQKCTFCSSFQLQCDRFPPTACHNFSIQQPELGERQSIDLFRFSDLLPLSDYYVFFWMDGYQACIICPHLPLLLWRSMNQMWKAGICSCTHNCSAHAAKLLKFLDLCRALPLIHSFFGRKKKQPKKHQN